MGDVTCENGQQEPRYAATMEGVRAAADRISPYIHRTPIMTCSTIDGLAGRSLYFKCELFQKGGSFKFRGACNAVFNLDASDAQRGVITHSSGNHGGALALAAKLRGITATVVVPQGTPRCKIAAIQTYGGTVVECEATIDARERTCAELRRHSGATFIPPYNYAPVICGQATIALELLQQVENVDAVIVPVSGGGMLSGIAFAVKSLKPNVKVVAAEPHGSNDAADVARSKAAGELVACDKPATIADGLEARLGDLTWPIVRDLVDDVITVSDDDIVAAMQLCFERMKIVVEPSGAASVAAALSPQFTQTSSYSSCQHVAVVLSGGNIDLHAVSFWENWCEVVRKKAH